MNLRSDSFIQQAKHRAKVIAFAFCCLCFCAKTVAAQEITAIDFNGDLLGKVIPDGNVVSFDNSLIGNVTADSLIVNFDGDLIGGVVPQGIAIANDTSLLGKVSNDGTVRQPSGKVIGKVLPNGLVVNDYYDVLGAVLFPGLIYDDEGKTVGRLTGNGLYANLKGQAIGFVTPDGYAYRRVGDDYLLDGRLISSKMVISLSGDFLGSVVPGGEVSDFDGNTIGFIKANGYAYNEKNEIIGRIVKSGYAFDDAGRYLGYVTYNGEVISKGKSLGRQRADGSIIDANGKVFGFALDIASTATGYNGKYLGRIMPDGRLFKAKNSVGQVSSRGEIIASDGKTSGQIISTGPVFDYRASLIGHALSNGQLIALSGNAIGKMIGGLAFDMQGRLAGAVSSPRLVISQNNEVIGVSGINAALKNGDISKLVSPFGYVFAPDGSFGGMSSDFVPVYNQIGARVARIGLDGRVQNGGGSIGKLTQSGIAVDERNLILGRSLADTYAVNSEGNAFGHMGQDNLIYDNNKSVVAKITPDKAVVAADSATSPDLMPKMGTAFERRLVIDFDGSLLGYADNNGRVLDLNGTAIGKVTENGYVLDNNNILNGYAIAQHAVVDSKCALSGIITPRGDVRNFKNIYIGRILANGQVIDEAGSVVAHAVAPGAVIDFNGNPSATLGGNGLALNYNGETLGCLDFKNQIRNNNNVLASAPISYVPVIDFKDKIIGRVTMDGQVVGMDNQNLGYMQPDGNVNNRTGAPLGNLFRYTVAFDNNNRYFGRILEDGTVRNESGEKLSNVAFDGTVVNGINKLGYALYDFYAYDNDFKTVGVIGKDGIVRSFDNKKIGNLQRGFVVASDESVIARGNRDFYIRDNSNIVLGELLLSGDVVNNSGAVVGKLQNAGEITDSSGTVIAMAKPLQFYSRIAAMAGQTIVVDDNGKIVGRLDDNGNVIDNNGEVIATRDAEGNLVNNSGKVVGKVIDPDIVYDDEGKIVGRVMSDGSVVNHKGEVIGRRDENGKIVDGLGKIIGKLFDVNKVYDEKGNLVGLVQPDGSVTDANGKQVGRLNNDGTVTNANNNIIGGIGSDWYERVEINRPQKKDTDIDALFTSTEKKASGDNKYRRSLNIALSPDGAYIGDIMDDGSVVNKQGVVIGQKTPDGLILDDNGTLIGIEEIKKPTGGDIFVPAGTFGEGSAYGTGVGPGDNLGPGGGFGPGERYNTQRSAALAVAQGERRQNMQVGKISSNVRKEAFDGMQKDWKEQGIDKSLSSWRVDMSRMILADKPIPAVLARSIDSNNPTPVTAFVERNVYAEEGRNILIPAGSRFMGEFGGLSPTSEASSETGKVQITWQRLIRPDGSMFKFDGLTADAQGRGGALGYLDKQLFKRYTMPVLTSILTNAMAYMMAPEDESGSETETPKQQAANDARQNFLDQMNQMFEQILQDKASIQAMSYVPAGTRIIIFPKVDLWLRDIESDKEGGYESNNANVLINDEARLKGDNGGATVPTGGGSSSQVSYEEDVSSEETPKSAPLIAEEPKKTATTRPLVVPPPPPSSSTGRGSGTSGSGSKPAVAPAPPSSSGSSSAAPNNNQSVPQLF